MVGFSLFFYTFVLKLTFTMKYFEVHFTITCPAAGLMQDARDLLSALAGEAGFETFEETDEGVNGYVQQAFFDQQALDGMLEDFPMPDVSIHYEVCEADDKDWNAEWEAEGFEPIVIGDNSIVVHDGRHLPEKPGSINIEIDAKLAFGTGNHETTRLMLTALSTLLPTPSTVLDCGTGTGILAIAALMTGAKEAVGYDIDEWSADNACHNAVINRVDERFTPLLGDASVLDTIDQCFDLVIANINRNILLNDMPRFVQKMKNGATLLLSGFYVEDCDVLTAKAKSLGLQLTNKTEENGWACLRFTKD